MEDFQSNSRLVTLGFPDIARLIYDAREDVYVVMPSISEDVADILIAAHDGYARVHVCVDNSEEVIRNGYGSEKGLVALQSRGINISQCRGNRVSLIAADGTGYIYFPESRIFSANPSGFNALRIRGVQLLQLLHQFFGIGGSDGEEFKEQLDKKAKDELLDILNNPPQTFVARVAESFDETTFDQIKQKLIADPPLSPDLQRRLKTYTAKIQLVHAEFIGGHLEDALLKLPKDGLPVGDKELKEMMQASVKLIDSKTFLEQNKPIVDLRNRIEALKKKCLIPIDSQRKGKSVLKKSMKDGFAKEVLEIEAEIKKINKDIPGVLEKAYLLAKQKLRRLMTDYFRKNPPQKLSSKIQFQDAKDSYIAEFVESIMLKIKPPIRGKRKSETFALNINYYDLTWSDFSDKELLKTFESKGILSADDIGEIVALKDAYLVRANPD